MQFDGVISCIPKSNTLQASVCGNCVLVSFRIFFLWRKVVLALKSEECRSHQAIFMLPYHHPSTVKPVFHYLPNITKGGVSLSLSPRVFSSSPATSYYMESLSSISSRIKCLLLKVVDREQGERETRLFFFRFFLDDLHLQNTRQSNVPEYLQSTAR